MRFRHFDLGDVWRDRAHDTLRQLLLDRKDILENPVVAVRPEMVSGDRIDQLTGHANPVGDLADAAFQHVANTEVRRHRAHIDGLALVGEAAIAGNHEQLVEVRQLGDDVLGDAVGEVLLVGIAAHVLERQYGDGGFVR